MKTVPKNQSIYNRFIMTDGFAGRRNDKL